MKVKLNANREKLLGLGDYQLNSHTSLHLFYRLIYLLSNVRRPLSFHQWVGPVLAAFPGIRCLRKSLTKEVLSYLVDEADTGKN
jgi:hypothetical protein